MIPDGFKITEIGTLPLEWNVVTFTDCVLNQRIRVGKVKQRDYQPFGPFPIIDQSQNPIAGYWDNEGDVYQGSLPIIIFGDHTRAIKYVVSRFVCGADGTKVLVPNTDRFHPRFLYFSLLNLNIPSRGYNRHYPILKEQNIPLPPLPEQKKIAAVLSAVQDAKEKTEAVIQASRELKKSLMKHLFTYGPVSLTDAADVPLKETEIGMVPEEWDVCRLGDIVTSQYGYTASAQRDSIGPKFLRITDIDNYGNVNWADVPYCSISPEDYRKFAVKDHDILVARIGATTGKACIIKDAPECVFASYLIKLTVSDMTISCPDFIHDLTMSPLYWRQIDASKEGKLKKGVSATLLKELKIPLPPLPIQQQITGILSAVDCKIEAEEGRRQALEELFKTLLSNLMTGRIRVNNLEMGGE